eukprot:gene19625-6806_t
MDDVNLVHDLSIIKFHYPLLKYKNNIFLSHRRFLDLTVTGSKEVWHGFEPQVVTAPGFKEVDEDDGTMVWKVRMGLKGSRGEEWE